MLVWTVAWFNALMGKHLLCSGRGHFGELRGKPRGDEPAGSLGRHPLTVPETGCNRTCPGEGDKPGGPTPPGGMVPPYNEGSGTGAENLLNRRTSTPTEG